MILILDTLSWYCTSYVRYDQYHLHQGMNLTSTVSSYKVLSSGALWGKGSIETWGKWCMTFRVTYFQAKPRWTNMNQPLQLIPAGHLAMDPIVSPLSQDIHNPTGILSCTWWIDQYHWWRYATDLSKSLKVPIQFGIYSHFVLAAHAHASWFIILHLFFIKLLVNVPTLAHIPRSSQIFNKSHYTVRAIRYQSGRRSALAPFRSRNPPVSPPIGATLSSRTIWSIVWVVGSLLLGGKVASRTRGFHMFSPHNITWSLRNFA